MGKFETILVGIFVGIVCPLLTFFVFCGLATMAHEYAGRFPDFMVIRIALTGLGLGLLLDLFFLRKWIRRFYMANLWLMSIIYLALFCFAIAMFRGLPVGTFTLGLIAGMYMGRRESYVHSNSIKAVATLRRTALMAASITTLAALPIGVLALNEPYIRPMLETLLGLSQADLRRYAGFAIVGLLCLFLFFIQYWLSNKAGQLVFKIGREDAQ